MTLIVHGSSDLLQRFARGELEGELRDAVIHELASCAECRVILGALARREPSPEPLPRTYVHVPPRSRLLAPGAKVGGRYRVEAVLGEGGMGVVYRVRHELLGRSFALKMLHPDRAVHEGAVRRFLGEARTLASLGHQGIVDVVDLGHDDADEPLGRLDRRLPSAGQARSGTASPTEHSGRDPSPFLVMELLEGETLEDRLRREPRMALAHAFDAAQRMADALGVAHARGIIHRDIKPANIFLREPALSPGWVKLLDFGLAKLRGTEEEGHENTLTRTGAVLGTPRYMAPEQWRADKDLDARVDVFSWGVTTYRMLTGELPFHRPDTHDLLPPSFAEGPDLRQMRPEVPLAVAEIVERSLSRDRSQRPLDGSALATEWKEAVAQFSPRRSDSVRPRPSNRPSMPDSARGSDVEEQVVGRRAELEALMDRVKERRSPLLIVGPEGIGKSALIGALVRELRTQGQLQILRADPNPSEGKPFAALSGLAADPHDLERSLRERLIGERARNLVLVIGDPSALDPESARLLADLSHEEGAFVLGEARAPESAALLGASLFSLGGLTLQGLDAFVRSRGAALDAGALAALFEHTGGHPLFALQCLALQRERGSSIDTVPAQIEDTIGARLASAPVEAAHAWQVAAVLRTQITESDLFALGVLEAGQGVEWLLQRGILRTQSLSSVASQASLESPSRSQSRMQEPLAFTAGLFADVAERALDAEARALLHRGAASLRTKQLNAKSERRAWAQIARHHELGGDLGMGSDSYARAVLGAGALDLMSKEVSSRQVFGPEEVAFAQRARWAERALELAERLGRPRRDAVELALVRIEGLEGESKYEEAIAALDAIEAQGWSADQEARGLVRRGTYLQRLGRHDVARSTFTRAERAARSAALPDTLALALGRQAVCLALAGRLEEARDLLLDTEELVLTEAPLRRADLAGWKAQIAGLSGDLGARRDAYWAAVELFRAEGNHRFAAFSLLNLGDTYARLGAYEEAERALAKAHAECVLFGASTMAGYAALNWGHALLRLGRLEQAGERMREAEEIAERGGDRRLAAYCALYRTRMAIETSMGEREALVLALAALRRDPEHQDPAWSALADATLAQAALVRNDEALALSHARAAEAIVEQVGALEEGEAEVALALADALLAHGDTQEAQSVLRRGAARVREVARKIAGAHWRARFLEDVPAHRALLARSP